MRVKTLLEWCKYLNIKVENKSRDEKQPLKWWRHDQANLVNVIIKDKVYPFEVKRGKVNLNKITFISLLNMADPIPVEGVGLVEHLEFDGWRIVIPPMYPNEDSKGVSEVFRAMFLNELYRATLEILLPNITVNISAAKVRLHIAERLGVVTVDNFDKCTVLKTKIRYKNEIEVIGRA